MGVSVGERKREMEPAVGWSSFLIEIFWLVETRGRPITALLEWQFQRCKLAVDATPTLILHRICTYEYLLV